MTNQEPNSQPNNDVNPANVDMTPLRMAQRRAEQAAGIGGLPIIPKTEPLRVSESDNPNMITSEDVSSEPEMVSAEVIVSTSGETKIPSFKMNVSSENLPESLKPVTPTPEPTIPPTTTPETVPPTTQPPVTTTLPPLQGKDPGTTDTIPTFPN